MPHAGLADDAATKQVAKSKKNQSKKMYLKKTQQLKPQAVVAEVIGRSMT